IFRAVTWPIPATPARHDRDLVGSAVRADGDRAGRHAAGGDLRELRVSGTEIRKPRCPCLSWISWVPLAHPHITTMRSVNGKYRFRVNPPLFRWALTFGAVETCLAPTYVTGGYVL